MLTISNVLKLVLLVLLVGIGNIDAFPNGVGATCEAGDPMPQFGPHAAADTIIVKNSVPDSGVTFTIAGKVIDPATPMTFPADQDIPFEVKQEPLFDLFNSKFKGIFFRLQAPEGVDATFALNVDDDDDIVLSEVCDEQGDHVVGFHHDCRPLQTKDAVGGTIRFDENVVGAKIDITLVYLLTTAEPKISVYANSRYIVNFEKTCENHVTGFHLINPNLDRDDMNFKVPLPDVINLSDFYRDEINIEAETFDCPETDEIECVEISFSGTSQNERKAPYALYGDNEYHFFAGTPDVGDKQELKACTYTDRQCSRDEKCTSVMVDVVKDDGGDRDIPCSECDNDYHCGKCLMEVNDGRGKCPLDSFQLSMLNHQNCNGRYLMEYNGEKYCEADGECNTKASSTHDTCDNYEVYRLVSCTEDRHSRQLRGESHL